MVKIKIKKRLAVFTRKTNCPPQKILVFSYSFVNFISVNCFEDWCLNFFNIGCFLMYNYLKLLSFNHNCHKKKKKIIVTFICCCDINKSTYWSNAYWNLKFSRMLQIHLCTFYIKPRQLCQLMKLNFSSTVQTYMFQNTRHNILFRRFQIKTPNIALYALLQNHQCITATSLCFYQYWVISWAKETKFCFCCTKLFSSLS